jgi:hypothetical protein
MTRARARARTTLIISFRSFAPPWGCPSRPASLPPKNTGHPGHLATLAIGAAGLLALVARWPFSRSWIAQFAVLATLAKGSPECAFRLMVAEVATVAMSEFDATIFTGAIAEFTCPLLSLTGGTQGPQRRPRDAC